jgi:hypothetical protein
MTDNAKIQQQNQSAFNMVNAKGSGMHNHTISGRIIGKPVTQNNITTISGPVTVTLKDGPHSGVPATIKFTDKSIINISLDPSKVKNHLEIHQSWEVYQKSSFSKASQK